MKPGVGPLSRLSHPGNPSGIFSIIKVSKGKSQRGKEGGSKRDAERETETENEPEPKNRKRMTVISWKGKKQWESMGGLNVEEGQINTEKFPLNWATRRSLPLARTDSVEQPDCSRMRNTQKTRI